MRRPPSFCRNPDGRAYATIPGSGRKRVYFGHHGTKEAEAAYRKWLAGLLADDPPEPPPVGPNPTMADLAAAYMAHAIGYYAKAGKPSREYHNIRFALRAFLAHCRDDRAAAFGPKRLRWYRDQLAANGWTTETGQARKYDRKTVNKYVGKVRRFLRWCEGSELVRPGLSASLATVEPLQPGKSKAADRPKVKPVPWPVVEATLPFMRRELRDMVLVQYWSAMRPGEVCSMARADVDTTRTARDPATGQDVPIWIYVPPEHKTSHLGMELAKAIPRQGQDILARYMLAADSDTSPLFRTYRDRPYIADTYGTAVEKSIGRANRTGRAVPHWTPNQLRHAIAKRVESIPGFGRESAQHFLGHSRLDTTAIYAGRSEAVLFQVAVALGRTG